MYAVFVRNWWKNNRNWPDGLEPCAGKRRYLQRHIKTAEEARAICSQYAKTHKPGRLSRKAEYEET